MQCFSLVDWKTFCKELSVAVPICRWRNRYKGANKLFAQVFQKLTNIRAKNKNQVT